MPLHRAPHAACNNKGHKCSLTKLINGCLLTDACCLYSRDSRNFRKLLAVLLNIKRVKVHTCVHAKFHIHICVLRAPQYNTQIACHKKHGPRKHITEI